MNFYISSEGKDSWSGKSPSPNASTSKRDGPFATLEKAKDTIRWLKRNGKLPKGGVTIWIREGVYKREATFKLTSEDSGTPESPIVYRAYRNEKPRFIGGEEISAHSLKPIEEPSILSRLEDSCRNQVRQIELKKQGINHFGDLRNRGFGRKIQASGLELFFRNRPMQLARWPNSDWAKIAATPAGKDGGKFTYEGDRPKRWLKSDDIWLHGYWTWDWADSYEKVKHIDAHNQEIHTHEPHGVYGYAPNRRYYAFNMLEELDEPGEWYLDRKTGILYFYPPDEVGAGELFVSIMEEPIISLEDVSYTTFVGLSFEYTRGSAVEVAGGARNLIAKCNFQNIGTFAVSIQSGAKNGISACDISETGEGAVILDGGDRRTLTSGGNYVHNNQITRFSRWVRTYRPAVLISGVGNRISHNLIYDAPHSAIILGGNEHLIEFNEIHHVCMETSDAGAFYMGRDYTQRGNIVRYNFFHHLKDGDVQAIYLDDWTSGTTVFGNICYKAGRGVLVGGGRDNTIENNVFVDCKPAVHVDARGLGWAKYYFDGTDNTLFDRLKAVNHNQPPYSACYPELVSLLDDEPAVPKGNKIIANIASGGSGGRWLDLRDRLDDKTVKVADNLVDVDIGDDIGMLFRKGERFGLSNALPLGRIPTEKIGLIRDAYRAKLPIDQQPIPRKDAFFGLHFDLHPQKTDTALGADISAENIERFLRSVRPDYVQYDCKGHAGYTGYPTKIGWASPGIVKDSLSVWRNATRQHGVGLYIHYSGVWDSVAIEHHPEWARIDAEGKADKNSTSTFGSYVDQLLIPQLKEVVSAYDLDGLWVDGDCWAAKLDYSSAAIEEWRKEKETGYTDAPKDKNDLRWLEWKMFHRRQFEKYLCHWVDALHKFKPDLQITSNWMYTTFAPKPIVAKLDYLSGDYSPTLSADRARVEARYLANTGMPWDLMAWGFNNAEGFGHSLKTAEQLKQEAAVVLMQGGGFQVYYQPTRSGYIIDEITQTMSQVADFCRSRQKASHKSLSVPQVTLLLSSETLWERSDNVLTPWGGCFDELEGALHALLELHYSVDILAEHQLLDKDKIDEFPLIVIPDSYKLADDFKKSLIQYVERGGGLLLLGERCARLFEPQLGVKLEGEPHQTGAELSSSAGIVNVNGIWQNVLTTTAQAVGFRYPNRDTRKNGEVAATIASCGKGLIGAVYGPVALAYFRTHHSSLRQFIGDIAAKLFPEPDVRVEAPSCVDISLRKTADNDLALHFLNLANSQRANRFFNIDFIPPIGPIEVKIKLSKKPKRVQWIPDRRRLKWAWSRGVLSVKITKLHIHGAIIINV